MSPRNPPSRFPSSDASGLVPSDSFPIPDDMSESFVNGRDLNRFLNRAGANSFVSKTSSDPAVLCNVLKSLVEARGRAGAHSSIGKTRAILSYLQVCLEAGKSTDILSDLSETVSRQRERQGDLSRRWLTRREPVKIGKGCGVGCIVCFYEYRRKDGK